MCSVLCLFAARERLSTGALRGFSTETKLVQDGEFQDAKRRAIGQPIRGNYKCYGFLYRKGSHNHIPAGNELLALGGMEESAWEGAESFPVVGPLPYRGSSWVSSAVWDQNMSQRSSRHVLRHKRLQREQKHISAVDNYQKEKPFVNKEKKIHTKKPKTLQEWVSSAMSFGGIVNTSGGAGLGLLSSSGCPRGPRKGDGGSLGLAQQSLFSSGHFGWP